MIYIFYPFHCFLQFETVILKEYTDELSLDSLCNTPHWLW